MDLEGKQLVLPQRAPVDGTPIGVMPVAALAAGTQCECRDAAVVQLFQARRPSCLGRGELLPGQILSGSFSRAGTTLAASERPFLPASWSPRESDLVARTEVLLQAAAARLRALESGGDTALFLSGGVDSSLLALALKDRNPLSLTVTCEGYRHDDSPYARLVRDTLDLPGAEIPLNPETFAEGWWETIQALNAPLTSTNQVPWWLLCKESKARALSVAFSGEGADGWFVGGLYDEERDAMARLGAKDRDEVARRIIFCRTHVLNQPDLVERITAVPLAIHGRRAIWEDVREAGNGAPFDELAVLYHVRTAGNRLLTRADLVAAYHGIRLRLPYLEEHWLRWVRSLPYSLRNGEGIRKQPLKALCALHWGEAFSHRRKIGFPFPIRSWIRQGPTTLLRDWLGMLTDDLALSRGIYRTEALRQEIRCRVEGLRPNDWLLWSLINLELWLRHLEGRSSGA